VILYLLGREGWIREGYYISLLLGFVLLNVPAGISYELAEVLFWFNRMRWAAAVSEWNKGQSFRDDMYAIPKKGGDFYDEIRDIMGIKTREPKPEPLIPGGGRRSEKYEKEQEQRHINEFSRKINNFDSYWPDLWKSLSAQEKLNAYNDIAIIIDLQQAGTGPTYNALKEKIDKFTIPDYAKKGFELWKKKGKNLYLKEPKGKIPNTAYDKMQRMGLSKIEPKVETKVKSEIPISDLAEYHNALAGRHPRGVIAYYENKYPQLKNKLKK